MEWQQIEHTYLSVSYSTQFGENFGTSTGRRFGKMIVCSNFHAQSMSRRVPGEDHLQATAIGI